MRRYSRELTVALAYVLLLVLLAQFSGCAGFLCSLSLDAAFAPRHLSIAYPSVEEIAPLEEDHYLVVVEPVRARDLVGYGILQLAVQTPVVFFLCWLFGRYLAFVPPVK